MPRYRYRVIIGIIVALMGVSAVNKGYCQDDIDSLIPYIIQVESNGNANAYNSRTQAEGVMQITPVVFNEYNIVTKSDFFPNMLYEKDVNIQIGTWYLHRLKDHYLKQDYTIPRLLAAYNMGYGRLKRLHFQWWKIPETKHYVEKILKLYERR